MILPVFRDYQEGRLSQLDLARAIEQAVREGAQIINISGGERAPTGEPDAMLQRALRLCDENNVLVVAAAGNDGCACLQVPAADSSVLAVGALGRNGAPLEGSNWGHTYRSHGILAPGEGITGAIPGSGTATLTGTSIATPIVSGVAALLLSIQRHLHNTSDVRAVAEAILHTATACQPTDDPECERYLGGTLNIPQAYAYIQHGGNTLMTDLDGEQGAAVARQAAASSEEHTTPLAVAEASVHDAEADAASGRATAVAEGSGVTNARGGPDSHPGASPVGAVSSGVESSAGPECGCRGITSSSADCNCNSEPRSYVFALGQVGFDFGTEARRDTFRQLMPNIERTEGEGEDARTISVTPNPYDVFQLYDYMESRPYESTKVIWTLNLDLTPIYAIEAEVEYPEEVYRSLRRALRQHALPKTDEGFVARVSIPGILTSKSVELFSGQRVPLIKAQPRGLYMWEETKLVNKVVEAVRTNLGNRIDEDYVSKLVRNFLDKVYFECRNLGANPQDRALNFAATNAYQVGEAIAEGLLSGEMVPGAEDEMYTLDTIDVSKSPYCRQDSDCWDVRVTFFDPVNDRRARTIYQFTIDVSDTMPVSLAPARKYLAR